MFQDGNYSILDLTPPSQGLNQLIDLDVLPNSFASSLENILPTPLGAATVRYGTRQLPGVTLDPDASILEMFPFVKLNGDKQAVLYVQTFVPDSTAQNLSVLNPQQIRFDTQKAQAFQADTSVKIDYSHEGDTTLYSVLVRKSVTGNTVILTVEDNSFPFPVDDITIRRVSYAQGILVVYDFQTQSLGETLKTGLSVACVPRSVTFLNKLILCNGVDRVLIWDGDDLEEVSDFVKENATQVTRLDDRRFSFSCTASFEASHYAADRIIQLRINGSTRRRTVASMQRVGNTVTITTTINLPPFVADHTELFYQDWPPVFSYLMVAHNRLWALGPGAVGLAHRAPDQALRVYFSYQSNTLTGWFNPETKTVPSINLAEGHGRPDNLEAIAFVSGLMVFMGRHKTQVWTGSEPLGGAIDPSKLPLQFASLVSIGIVHGNLLVEMANDLYFVSQHGLLSFSTFNIAKQFAATSRDAIDPLVREHVRSLTNSNPAYQACRSFKYQSGAFCGFKIGFNKVLVSLYSDTPYAWTLFSGDFAKANTFLTELDPTLYLCIDHQLYQYGDGIASPPVYGDNNGKDLISFAWTPPVIQLPGKRFANKRYEILADYPSSFILDPENQVGLLIDGDLQKSFRLQIETSFPFKGDALNTLPFVDPREIGPNPNNPNPQALGFRLDEPYALLKGRLKFLSSRFSVTLTGSTRQGPLVFKKMRFFGIAERSS